MAYQATHWAWELELPTTQKFTLIALADMADESFTCYPGQKRLSGMIGASVATVRRALGALEEAGLLSREQRRRDDGYRTSDRYRLSVGTSPVKMPGENLTAQMEAPHRSSTHDLTAHSAGVITSKNHQSESPDISASAVGSAVAVPLDVVVVDPFDEFWEAYPLHKGKKEARDAYAKALKKASAATILAGARAYAGSLPAGVDLSKVKWAQGWLNGERWDDEYAPAKAPHEQGKAISNVERNAARILSLYGGGSVEQA